MTKINLAVTVLSVALCAWAEPVKKKIIATGWDTLRVQPEEILANADKFADSGIDGINITFSTHSNGKRINCSAIFDGHEFLYADVKKYVPIFRKIAVSPGLTESLLTVWWTPKKGQRLRWDDNEGWRIVANNMGVMAKLAKDGGLKGLFLDWEDYSNVGQFTRREEDPPIEETIKLARMRGRDIGNAVFKEFADVVFFSYWWLCSSSYIANLQVGEREYALKKSVWVAFVDGLFDVMPDGVKMIDGREHYHLESFRRDFYLHSSAVQSGCQALLSPENRAKYRRAVSASFGHYLDMYTNDESAGHWYYGPEGGSRLEHFRRNLEQSLAAATEYVWIYGEKGLFVPYDNCANGWIAKQQTWETKLQGFDNVLKNTKKRASLAKIPQLAKKKAAASSARSAQGAANSGKPADRQVRVVETQGGLPKKFIATGASMANVRLADLINEAPALAKLGIDGIALPVNAKDQFGNKIGSDGIAAPIACTASRLRPFIKDLKTMSTLDGLKESLIYINWSPTAKYRLSWTAEKRWEMFAHNMNMMAKLAKVCKLKGLFIDVGELDRPGQFVMTKKEKSYSYGALTREVRRRGRAVGKAIFSAYPDIVLFSTSWFSAEARLADPSDESSADRLEKSGSLWPAFVNGIVDVMPLSARLVDGGGNGSRDAKTNDYHKAMSDLWAVSHALVDEVNEAKLLTVLSAAAGDTLTRYSKDSPRHQFWRNLSQAARTSTEYVWIDVGDVAIAGKGASAQSLRIYDLKNVINQVKDERKWIEDYLKANAGSVIDLVPDPTTACGISKGYFAYVEPNKRDVAKIESDPAVGEGDKFSFKMTNCGLDGTLMFRGQNIKPNDVYIVKFSSKGYPVTAKAAWRENSAFRWNVPSVGLPVAAENKAGWRTASRIVRAPDMDGYNEMYLMIDMRSCKDDDCSWIDNVHVYKVK